MYLPVFVPPSLTSPFTPRPVPFSSPSFFFLGLSSLSDHLILALRSLKHYFVVVFYFFTPHSLDEIFYLSLMYFACFHQYSL